MSACAYSEKKLDSKQRSQGHLLKGKTIWNFIRMPRFHHKTMVPIPRKIKGAKTSMPL